MAKLSLFYFSQLKCLLETFELIWIAGKRPTVGSLKAAKLPGTETDLNIPTEAPMLWRLALAYEQQNNIENAKALLKQSVQLDPDLKEAAGDLKRLLK